MRTLSPTRLVTAALVISVLLITAQSVHQMATLDIEADLVNTECVDGEVQEVRVRLEHVGDEPRTLAVHSWDQRRHVRFAWLFEDGGRSLRIEPSETLTVTIVASSERARINNRSAAQIMFNDGQRREFVHFKSGNCPPDFVAEL